MAVLLSSNSFYFFMIFSSLLLCAGCHSKGKVQQSPASERPLKNTTSGSPASALQASAASPLGSASYAAHGKIDSITLEDNRLTFCDSSGTFTVALPGGFPKPEMQSCKPRKLEGACPEKEPVLDTRHPLDGAQDVIDTANNTFFLAGDVRDCAVNGSSIAVTTSSGVLLLDDATGKKASLSSGSGEYIALSNDWVAWSAGATIHARLRSSIGLLERSK